MGFPCSLNLEYHSVCEYSAIYFDMIHITRFKKKNDSPITFVTNVFQFRNKNKSWGLNTLNSYLLWSKSDAFDAFIWDTNARVNCVFAKDDDDDDDGHMIKSDSYFALVYWPVKRLTFSDVNMNSRPVPDHTHVALLRTIVLNHTPNPSTDPKIKSRLDGFHSLFSASVCAMVMHTLATSQHLYEITNSPFNIIH